ncbi:NAD+ synthase [Puteibacter caeruleilacunae]|nr:NAD+ synthase [Puteibacter caeruleilacunae]
MKIALAQQNYHIGNFKDNTQKIINAIEQAKDGGAELVVFSELSVCGYYPHDLLEKREFVDAAIEGIHQIADHCNGITAIVGGPCINEESKGKKLFNSAYILAKGEVQDVFHKTLLPTYDIFDEYRHFEPNNTHRLLEINGKKIAVTICEDIWDKQPTSNKFAKDKIYTANPMAELSKLNPDLIVNLSASPFSYNQEDYRKNILLRNASKYNLPIVYVNQVGAQTEIIFDGGSMYVDKNGLVKQELNYFEEDFRIIDTTSEEVMIQEGRGDYVEKIYNALVLGIRDYFHKSGLTKATLGLSGGIDSALVAVLAVDALGAENVRVLLMPSKYSSDHSVNDAVQLAENLGIQHHTINIQQIVDRFEDSLEDLFTGLDIDVTEENIQARTRGTLVMALSNKFGNILLNTTNKSECAVGYGTLYGDMNGGLAVLGDVYKLDAYKMAHFINREKEIIPVNTIVKPPSAELRPDQKDSDSLPDYEILDGILFRYIEQNMSPEEIYAEGFEKAVVDKVISMVNFNEYKRFQAPPILRVSSKAFGFGRKMPLVANYKF